MRLFAHSGRKKYSVQAAFISTFFLFIAVMMMLLNTYPTVSSRDAVFSSKKSMMVSQATLMTSSLSELAQLSRENVGQIMEHLDVHSYDRVLVTDNRGLVVYDTAAGNNSVGRYAIFGSAAQALGGEVLFNSAYDGDAFSSNAAAPVVNSGRIIGCVCLYEYDEAQARLIAGVQTRLRSISFVAGIMALVSIYFLTKALTRRLRAIVDAMHIVREGDYDYRIVPEGQDEVAELAVEFNDMTQRLQSTEELRRRFVSDASHELRTPLASIRLLSDSIVQSENMDPETMREFVTDIGSEAERLQRMTEKLMRLTKMDSGMPVDRRELDMAAVAEKTVHLLEPLAAAKQVSIHCSLHSGCRIRASEDDIYQVIFNLAENAIKYNRSGGDVFLKTEPAGDSVLLTVEDTGIGIPDEDVPHIFSRFYRVDKARSSEVGGSGLGLSIVSDAVKANGGSIKVEHREGGGSRFVVSFPLYTGGEADG